MPRPTLSVPQPCHESWAAMTPAAQGRHCAACDKVVVDFTRMTDAEILAYLGQSAGKSCGRFRQEQLNRPLLDLSVPAAPWRLWLAAIAALGLAPGAHAQAPRPVPIQQQITLGMVATPSQPAQPSLPLTIIRGLVTDETGTGLPGVTILLKGTQIGAASNSDGSFELRMPAVRPVTLIISSVGYETQELTLRPDANQTELTVTMAMTGVVLGRMEGVVLPWYTPRSLWWRLTRPFRR
ncbi:carboxypeptidase-like regulatory domain-containing protein [Hymenobacter sp. DG01]|uniref:carboxypeptidase-like regulatory domain-containing protein n=1 Tax=Hymenobacter sp. DG01 TaxID=2584940 RepID=UPI00112473FD|nr:carboxypeptidase-like regulatory domain-containing protein [Hymenobacter sp. DG01]